MHLLPWWLLVACPAPAALAAYLLLGRTQAGGSPRALFALTAVTAPVVLAVAAAAAVVLTTLLSATPDERTTPPTGRPDPPVRAERTGAEAPTEGTELTTNPASAAPATGGPSASAGASPPASASAPASP